MLFAREWPILLVDDEPDVLAVSRLAMRNIQVDGLPIKLHTASSKAEAVALLNGPLGGAVAPYIAVAFIDVVMETDTAGLELCQFIRETLKNRLMQIFIRTGQPGVAPERQVIDAYDINGYFSKVELTEDKLYSLVKAGVRQFRFTGTALAEFSVVAGAISGATSRANISRVLTGFLAELPLDGQGNATHEYHKRVCVMDRDGIIGGEGYTDSEAAAERDRLLRLGLQPLGVYGDGYVVDGQDVLVKIAASPTNAETYHLANLMTRQSPVDILLLAVFTRSIAALVQHAQAPAAVG